MYKHIVYLSAILLILPIVDAQACSCAAVSDQQRFLDAKDVFLGKVVETKLVTKSEKIDSQIFSAEQVSAKVEITKTIKGQASGLIEVVDGVANGANCAVGLFTGREYLFYLYDDNLLSICGGTKVYNQFSDDLLIEKMSSY